MSTLMLYALIFLVGGLFGMLAMALCIMAKEMDGR